MADFPPNLDDGELYLPSDIFPKEIPPNFTTPDVFPSELTYMEDLSQQLSSFNRPTPQPPLPPLLQFRPVQRVQTGFCSGPGGFPCAHCGHPSVRGFSADYRPGYQFQPAKPPPAQLERFVQGRGRAFQGQTRFLPVRVSGSGPAGTGVFLPRVFNADMRKKDGMRSGEQKQPMRNVGLGKQVTKFQHPYEKVLPQDWTY
ncbi:uncharacterized protein LOC131235064 isoform X2 [Magnolia sinica]|uniref:uncharacterized protein LOC131235064 isoform X2 n=1 Tax=Magnolia sinica TaxID=86752 RepID=UPI002658026F|nr:uncharacterized protein LOC131235064 isoform X2 [Magnolia sinica]